MKKMRLLVGILGLEPRMTGPPYPNACFCTAKLLLFSYLPNDLLTFLAMPASRRCVANTFLHGH